MRDAVGGTFNLTILFVFIVLVSSFALFSVNYYRAFSLKNRLLSLIESYEGNMTNTNLKSKAKDAVNKLGYHVDQSKMVNQGSNWECIMDEGWCYNIQSTNKEECLYTYNVKTFVNTNIPILNRIMGSTRIFEVKGSTKPIRRKGGC